MNDINIIRSSYPIGMNLRTCVGDSVRVVDYRQHLRSKVWHVVVDYGKWGRMLMIPYNGHHREDGTPIVPSKAMPPPPQDVCEQDTMQL